MTRTTRVSPCDKFLYGFKGGLAPAVTRARTWPKWHESREEARDSGGKCGGTWGQHRERWTGVGGRQSLGRPGYASACRAGALRPGCPPPGPPPRAGPHGEPAATTPRAGSARTASGHEHQGDEASRPNRGTAKGAAAIGFGEKCTPQAPVPDGWRSPGTCQERFASLRDGLRPHLTEPVRRASTRRFISSRS